MGIFGKSYENNVVNGAIDVLNSKQSGLLVKGAVSTLIKHPAANPFAMRSLINVAKRHSDPDMRELATEGLLSISQSHKDPIVRKRAQDALNQLED